MSARFLPLLVLLVAATLAGSAAAPPERAGGATPVASTSAGFLTIAEAQRATRREVYRIARKSHDEIEEFRIEWCRRRSPVRVGCRYTIGIPYGIHWIDCHGGVRVIERRGNRHHPRAWRECIESSNG